MGTFLAIDVRGATGDRYSGWPSRPELFGTINPGRRDHRHAFCALHAAHFPGGTGCETVRIFTPRDLQWRSPSLRLATAILRELVGATAQSLWTDRSSSRRHSL